MSEAESTAITVRDIPPTDPRWFKFNSRADLVAHLNNPAERVKYTLARLERYAKNSGGTIPDKVVNVASRLICRTNGINRALRAVVQAGRDRDLLGSVKPLRLELVGYVYFANSPLRPATLKIGFTTRIPEVRVRSLMANSGEQINLISSYVGTLLDEQMWHGLNESERVAGEWYFKPRWCPSIYEVAAAT